MNTVKGPCPKGCISFVDDRPQTPPGVVKTAKTSVLGVVWGPGGFNLGSKSQKPKKTPPSRLVGETKPSPGVVNTVKPVLWGPRGFSLG